jgi:hypothetical protein
VDQLVVIGACERNPTVPDGEVVDRGFETYMQSLLDAGDGLSVGAGLIDAS